MFFKKSRVKVPEYLEERVKEILTDGGIFRFGSFFDEFQGMLLASTSNETAGETVEGTVTPPNRDLFINLFIGTVLWLIKYRTLTSANNSPRKLAFLDLKFDIEMPDIIDKYFQQYDTETIKESYDSLDLRCKKAFTGELQKMDEPRFLVSPIWAKNLDPHPFNIAAQIFVEDIGHKSVLGNGQTGSANSLTGLMKKRFMELTQPAADASASINFFWMFNR
jgi:hypothetical protein